MSNINSTSEKKSLEAQLITTNRGVQAKKKPAQTAKSNSPKKVPNTPIKETKSTHIKNRKVGKNQPIQEKLSENTPKKQPPKPEPTINRGVQAKKKPAQTAKSNSPKKVPNAPTKETKSTHIKNRKVGKNQPIQEKLSENTPKKQPPKPEPTTNRGVQAKKKPAQTAKSNSPKKVPNTSFPVKKKTEVVSNAKASNGKVKKTDQKPQGQKNELSKSSISGSDKEPLDLGYMPFEELKEKLEEILEETFKDSSIERKICYVAINKNDIKNFWDCYVVFGNIYKYPLYVGLESDNRTNIKEEGDILYKSVILENYTKREEDAKRFPAHCFGGVLDPQKVNLDCLNNLLALSGLMPEDFAEGEHGFTEKIHIKDFVTLKNGDAESAQKNFILSIDEELRSVRTKTDKKDVSYQYVALVFQVPEGVDYTINDLKMSSRQKDISLKQFYEHEEKRIYLLFRNELRTTLDLHQHSLDEADEKIRDFIEEKWSNFESSCKIITGAGNHSPIKGFSILKKKTKELLRSSEMSDMIQKVKPLSDYGFEVFLKQAKFLDLMTVDEPEEQIRLIIDAIKEVMDSKDPSLRIKHSNINQLRFLIGVHVIARLGVQKTFSVQSYEEDNECHILIDDEYQT